MKAITITIPEDLDVLAANEALRRGISKSELIRLGLAAVLPDVRQDGHARGWHELGGFGSADVTVEAGEIDDIVYGT